jgi:hypothetical protein
MHHWGDEWDQKNGADLNRAINYCMDVFRAARIGSHGKEKYGTFRDHVYFWDGGIHTLIWPGYVHIMNSFLYFKLDWYVIKPFTKYSGLLWLGHRLQAMAYNYAFQSACKKWPNVVDELIMCVDAPELIKPGIFGPIDGKVVRDRHWTTLED